MYLPIESEAERVYLAPFQVFFARTCRKTWISGIQKLEFWYSWVYFVALYYREGAWIVIGRSCLNHPLPLLPRPPANQQQTAVRQRLSAKKHWRVALCHVIRQSLALFRWPVSPPVRLPACRPWLMTPGTLPATRERHSYYSIVLIPGVKDDADAIKFNWISVSTVCLLIHCGSKVSH